MRVMSKVILKGQVQESWVQLALLVWAVLQKG